jgi:hypothetical protein
VEAYINNREWRDVHLRACPLHPSGGCSFARHGSYARVAPPSLRIARWYCPQGHRTFSLLPDFLAARLPGLLDSVEESVSVAAWAKSMEAAADLLRGFDVTLPSAVRWLNRRLRAVQGVLDAVSRLVPETPIVAVAKAAAPRIGLGRGQVLLRLRRSLSLQILNSLPGPLGFQSLPHAGRAAEGLDQHDMGPDTRLAASYGTATDVTDAPCEPSRSIQWSQPPRPPPMTCFVSGAPTAVCRSPAVCICSGSGAFAPTAHSATSLNVTS